MRRRVRLTSSEADLYYFLIQESNIRGWENPFECSNGLISSSIGITEKTLINARKRLQLKGFISYEAGQRKKKSPVYTLLHNSKGQSNKDVARRKTAEKRNPAKDAKATFLPPTSHDVEAYCKQRNNSIDPQQFINFYTAKDWMIGKNKMKDWRAAVRTWEHRNALQTSPTLVNQITKPTTDERF